MRTGPGAQDTAPHLAGGEELRACLCLPVCPTPTTFCDGNSDSDFPQEKVPISLSDLGPSHLMLQRWACSWGLANGWATNSNWSSELVRWKRCSFLLGLLALRVISDQGCHKE